MKKSVLIGISIAILFILGGIAVFISDMGVTGNVVVDYKEHCKGLKNEALDFCEIYNKLESKAGDKYLVKEQLGWGESRMLRSYIEMYYVTEDTYYLDKMIVASDEVLSLMDIKQGVKDFSGKSAYGWSNTVYTNNGEAYREVVHSGMILFPIVKFVDIIYSTPELKSNSYYKGKADKYLVNIKKVVGAHENRWVSGPNSIVKSDEGYYYWASSDPIGNAGYNLPHNQQLAMGSVLINLYKLGGGWDYKDRAKRMGRIFWRDLDTQGNSYVWHYWWGDSLSLANKYEDVSHGSIDLEYFLEAYNKEFSIGNSNNLFPTQEDMIKLVNTFNNNLYGGAYSSAERVDGSGSTSDMRLIGGWIDLAQFDDGIYYKIKKVYSRNNFETKAGKLYILTYAKLAKWAKVYDDGICTDKDGDGYYIDGGDCGQIDFNDNDANIYPGPIIQCISFTYSSWNSCSVNGLQTRTVLTSSPSGCQGGNPITIQTCTHPCIESDWSSAISPTDCPSNGQQTKTWSKIGQCEQGVLKGETETINCNPNIGTCTSFNYSEWDDCTSSGTQSRNVLTSLPEICQGGNPEISRTCQYVAPVISSSTDDGSSSSSSGSTTTSDMSVEKSSEEQGTTSDEESQEIIDMSRPYEKEPVLKRVWNWFKCLFSKGC